MPLEALVRAAHASFEQECRQHLTLPLLVAFCSCSHNQFHQVMTAGAACIPLMGPFSRVALGTSDKPVESPLTLQEVAMVYVGTALFFVLSTYALAFSRGWLQPFLHGLHGTFALLLAAD